MVVTHTWGSIILDHDGILNLNFKILGQMMVTH